MVIETPLGKKVILNQRVNAKTNRIICYAKVGEKTVQGNQMGFIKACSTVDLYLPLESRVDVHIDQLVQGKQTIIGWLK